VKNRVAAKYVTFILGEFNKLAEENYTGVREDEWTAVCRHDKAVEEEYTYNRDDEAHSVKEGIVINPNDDNSMESSDVSDEEDMKDVVMASKALIYMSRDDTGDEINTVLGS
jgi:hypothetical protein